MESELQEWAAQPLEFLTLFRCDVVNQSVYFGIAQLRAEGRHERTAELDSDDYVRAIRLSVAEGKFLVLEQVIQARAEFSCVFLIFVDVVADRAVLAIQIASCN